MPVHYENIGNAAVITISNPKTRNAVDRATAIELAGAWQRFESDAEAVVGILTGAGGTFCSGADLKAMDLADGPGGWLGMSRLQVTKPTIASIAGHCVAGGLELALWCDLRVAGEDAVFGCFERRFGVPLVDGGTVRLPLVVGLSRALDLILTGRPIDAAEAHRIGLVDRVVSPDAELAATLDLAEMIAAFPQATVRSDRASVYAAVGLSITTGLASENRFGHGVLRDAVAGAARYRSSRETDSSAP
ncbi:MAG: crotonase/enoyl-CoA hydratase family protein [Acidimicrobiia bacterium]